MYLFLQLFFCGPGGKQRILGELTHGFFFKGGKSPHSTMALSDRLVDTGLAARSLLIPGLKPRPTKPMLPFTAVGVRRGDGGGGCAALCFWRQRKASEEGPWVDGKQAGGSSPGTCLLERALR